MNYEFKGTQGIWYPVQYILNWEIQTEPNYSFNTNILDEQNCKLAKNNATLMSKSPMMFELLNEIWCSANEYEFELPHEFKVRIEKLLSESTNILP